MYQQLKAIAGPVLVTSIGGWEWRAVSLAGVAAAEIAHLERTGALVVLSDTEGMLRT